jgi:hypothetical protein
MTVGHAAAKVQHGDSIGNLLNQVHVVIDYKNGEPVCCLKIEGREVLL